MIPGLLEKFPDVKVYVDEREAEDYLKVVPPAQLFFHPSLPNQHRIMAYALEREPCETVLMLDDDLEYVASFVDTHPRVARYTTAADLARIVSNTVNRMYDLDVHWAGWNTAPHPGVFNPTMPVSVTGCVRGAMVVRGRDTIVIDPDVDSFDLDCTLQALLKDRFLLKDMRFFWSFGHTHRNKGGHRSVENSLTWGTDRERLLKKWGNWININNKSVGSRMHGGTPGKAEAFGHVVPRKATVAGV